MCYPPKYTCEYYQKNTEKAENLAGLKDSRETLASDIKVSEKRVTRAKRRRRKEEERAARRQSREENLHLPCPPPTPAVGSITFNLISNLREIRLNVRLEYVKDNVRKHGA